MNSIEFFRFALCTFTNNAFYSPYNICENTINIITFYITYLQFSSYFSTWLRIKEKTNYWSPQTYWNPKTYYKNKEHNQT